MARSTEFKVVKNVLIGVQVFMIIGSVVILAGGIDVLVEMHNRRDDGVMDWTREMGMDRHDAKNQTSNVSDSHADMKSIASIMIAVMAINIVIALMGLIGTIREHLTMASIFALIMGVVFILQFFSPQRPRAMAVILQFAVTVLAFAYVSLIKREGRRPPRNDYPVNEAPIVHYLPTHTLDLKDYANLQQGIAFDDKPPPYQAAVAASSHTDKTA